MRFRIEISNFLHGKRVNGNKYLNFKVGILFLSKSFIIFFDYLENNITERIIIIIYCMIRTNKSKFLGMLKINI